MTNQQAAIERFRTLICALIAAGPERFVSEQRHFWELVDVVRKPIAYRIMAYSRFRGDHFLENVDDAAMHFVVNYLLADGGKRSLRNLATLERIACGDIVDPFKYLVETVLHDLHDYVNQCPLEWASSVEQEERGMSLDYAIRQTVSVIEPLTAPTVTPFLSQAVEFFAYNPPKRERPLDIVDAAASLFRAVSHDRLGDISSVSWGTAPNRAQSSLLAGFLTNDHFNPYTRIPVVSLLRRYRDRSYSSSVA